MSDLITIEQVRAAASRLDPQRTNPGGGYRYTVGEEHCVAGQLLVELGLGDECPGEDSDLTSRSFPGLQVAENFEQPARDAITAAQNQADHHKLTWGEALRSAGLLP